MTIDYKSLDWKFILATAGLSLIGIALIYSAHYNSTTGSSLNFYIKQSFWLLLAFILFNAVVHIPVRVIDFIAYPLYGLAFLLLILVLVAGESRMGASRWFSLGFMSVSPSDIALSRFFAYTKLPPQSKRRLALSAILAFIPALLVMKQPDLGSSLVFVVLLFSLWFWSGLSPAYLILIISPLVSLVAAFHWVTWVIYLVLLIIFMLVLKPGILFGVIVFTFNLAFGMITPFIWNHLEDYQKLRVINFLDPGRDPQRAGYQIIQSKIAIGSGGII